MIPIKFRGRDAYGKYCCGDLWQRNDGTVIYDGEVWHRVACDSIAQFVGYDSQYNEVYEGDKLTDSQGNIYIAKVDSVVEWQSNVTPIFRRAPFDYAKEFTELTLKENQS